MNNRVLVTGAKGFIGRNIVNKLKESVEIVGCGRSNYISNEYRYIKWDIGTDDEPSEIIDHLDCIVHCAACLDKDNLSKKTVQTNCIGAFNILKYAIKHRIKKIIYMSSLPIVESAHSNSITEEALYNPLTLYHATKAAAEMILRQSMHYGIRFISLRIPSPIGPDMPRKTIVPIFIQRALNNEDLQILGKGSRKQNYLDVRDIAEAVKRIIDHHEIDGIFNIGSKNIISNYELAKLCIDSLDSKSKIILYGNDSNDMVDWSTDDTKLVNLIGNYQEYSIRESIIDIARNMR